MGGHDHHRLATAAPQLVDDDAFLVDVDTAPADAQPVELVAGVGVARVLDSDDVTASVAKSAHCEAETVGEPVADDDVIAIGGDAPNTAQVLRDRLAQLDEAPRVDVARDPRQASLAGRHTSPVATPSEGTD